MERHNDPCHKSHRPCGRVVVCRLASLGHDVVAMVRDVQAASRRQPSAIALRIADYEDASALQRALAGIDDMVPFLAMATRAQSCATTPTPSRQLRRPTSGILLSRRVVAIPLLTCLPRRRAPTSGLQCAFDHPQMWPIFRLYSIGLCRAKRRESLCYPQDMVALHRSRVTT